MHRVLEHTGLPKEILGVIQGLVSRAGYDLDHEGELAMGMTAVLSTLRVCDALRTYRAPPSNRVGRNDPCPCGSGKKHKKCCLKAGGADPQSERYTPGNPLERADLVPRLNHPAALAQDLAGLEGLFCSDPTLCEVRFSPEKMVAFLLADLPGAELPPVPDDPGEKALERARQVAHYLQEVEGVEALGNLDRALLQAARDSAKSDEDVRSLATGVALAELAASADPADEREAPNPLLSLLFWLTLQETVDTLQNISAGPALLFPAGDFYRKAPATLPAVEWGDDLVAALGPPDETNRVLSERIRSGRFPVGLPLLSALPAWVRLSLLAPSPARPEEVAAALRAGAEALGTEDADLLNHALDLWWEDHHASACSEDLEDVEQVRTRIAEGVFGALGLDFLIDAVHHRSCFSLRGEPDLPETTAQEGFSVGYLEACGDFLEAEDCLEMAFRTWRLCALLGPLPDSVATKLAELDVDAADGDE